MQAAGEHVARAIAELTHALQRIGDHATVVAISETVEALQLAQSQLATSAERAYSLGQLSARAARHAVFERQVRDAAEGGDRGA